MTLELIAGGLVLLFGVFLGSKFLGQSKGSKGLKLEHSVEAERDKAVKSANDAHEKAVAKIRQETKDARSRPVSDVLVDLIKAGEVVR